MPKYVYRCNECDSTFQIFHGMFEIQESCEICNLETSLVRIPQINFINKKSPTSIKHKVGEKVVNFIEESKKTLKEQQKQLQNKDWEQNE